MALLLNEKIIALQPSLIRALDGDLHGAIVLQQIAYWMPRAESEYDGHTWVWKTYPAMAEETALTVDQCRKATRRLETMGLLISCQPERGTRTKWYRIDFDHPILASDHAANRPHHAANSPVPCGESAASTSITENTSESTTTQTPSGVEADEEFAPIQWSDDVIALCDLLGSRVDAHFGAKKNRGRNWHKDMDMLLRRGPLGWTDDPPAPDKVANLINWIFDQEPRNGFCWADNIQSPAKLRTQYVRLRKEALDSLAGRRASSGSTSVADRLAAIDALDIEEES